MRAGQGGAKQGRGQRTGKRLDVTCLVLAVEEFSGVLLGVAADLADDDDAFGLLVFEEQLDAVDEVGAAIE